MMLTSILARHQILIVFEIEKLQKNKKKINKKFKETNVRYDWSVQNHRQQEYQFLETKMINNIYLELVEKRTN